MEFISSEKTRDKYDIGNIIEDFQNGILKDGDEVDIKGAIHNIRDMSDFAFIILRGGRLELQCVYAPEDNPSFTLADIEEEDCVIAHGRIVKEERSRRAIAVADEMTQRYRASMVGSVQEILFEEPSEGYFTGHAPNYVRVYAEGGDLHNQIRAVRITDIYRDGVLGIIE